MTSPSSAPIVVVGGGIAGLTTAALLGRIGLPVVLLEKASQPGGRAVTRNRNGFLFNLGPHALYRAGILRQTFETLGIDVRGGVPAGSGGYALRGGRRHTLPAGLTSLISTGLLGLGGKLELARFQTRLGAIDTSVIQREPLAAWLDAHVADLVVRQLLEMLVRVTTFTNDPTRQSAGAALQQMQLAVRANVLYLDDGWQTIVDGLRRVALECGVRICPGAQAVSLEQSRDRAVEAVRLADGTAVRASAVVIAAGPSEVDAIAGTAFAATLPPPVRIATLDVALRSLPKPQATVAFGVDVPLYFSVHSAIAHLAPEGGALVHVSRYLRADERAGRETEVELQHLMDLMQPGWRAHVEHEQFVPSLTVTPAQLTAANGGIDGRPTGRLDAFTNVHIAGDWIGRRGQLSDAAAASAADAADAIQAALRARPRSLAARPLEAPAAAS